MLNQLKAANQNPRPLLGGQIHKSEPPRTKVDETFMSCREHTSDGGNIIVTKKRSITRERSKTGRAWKKAIIWLLSRLGCSKKNLKVEGCEGAGSKWYNAVKWKKGRNDRKTNVADGDTLDKENPSSRLSQVPYLSGIFDDFDREAYVGRRTSIGSVERNDATILFNILDDLKDFKDTKKSKVNLGRLQRHILARYGDSR